MRTKGEKLSERLHTPFGEIDRDVITDPFNCKNKRSDCSIIALKFSQATVLSNFKVCIYIRTVHCLHICLLTAFVRLDSFSWF